MSTIGSRPGGWRRSLLIGPHLAQERQPTGPVAHLAVAPLPHLLPLISRRTALQVV